MTLYDHLIVKLRQIFPDSDVWINVDTGSLGRTPFLKTKRIYVHHPKDGRNHIEILESDKDLYKYVQKLSDEKTLMFSTINEHGGFYD